MSAEILRRAANLMRERAGAATPGPWLVDQPGDGAPLFIGNRTDGSVYSTADRMGDLTSAAAAQRRDDAEHIASWHPAVALAVADWLDSMYRRWEAAENSLSAMSVRAMSGGLNHPDPDALAVARAYLGEQP